MDIRFAKEIEALQLISIKIIFSKNQYSWSLIMFLRKTFRNISTMDTIISDKLK